MSTVTLESDRVQTNQILKSLRGRAGRATTADVVVDTGIPTIEAERLLRGMISDYPCHLDVTDDGDLVYEFEARPRRYDQTGRFQLWLARHGERLWEQFSKAMKALIAVVMVVYVVLFVCLIIAAMVAAQRGNNNSRSSFGGRSHGNRGGGGLFWFWYFAFGRSGDPYRTHRWHNPRYQRFGDRKRTRPGKDPRPFYLKVYDFVLGPDAADLVPVDDASGLLTLVRSRGGAVSTADVVRLTGWSLQRAEHELTQMMGRYDGNIVVTDDGELVFTFETLLTTAGGKKARGSGAFWDRWETMMPLTGNTPSANALIIALNSFNLVAAAVGPQSFLQTLQLQESALSLFFLSWFPLAFCGLVFLIPMLRAILWVWPENRRRRRRNLRRAAYQQAFAWVDERVDRGLESEYAVSRAKAVIPSWVVLPGELEEDLPALLRGELFEMGGDAQLPDEGTELTYHYDQLSGGLSASEQVRQALRSETPDLRVVFSTKAAEPAPEVAVAGG